MLPFLKFAPAPPPSAPEPRSHLARGQAVGDSEDLRRVLALPRRQRPTDEQLRVIAEAIKARFGKGPVRCECQSRFKRRCCDNLLPTQAWALYEAHQVGGLLGPIGVGHGKTLLDLLTPMVVDAKVAVLLLPPNLKTQLTEVDFAYYGQHWQLPNLAGGRFFTPGRPMLHVVAFSELSGAKSTELLDRISPDCVVVDEAHSVRNRTAARTKRFLRFLKGKPNVKVFCWSGTLTSRSLLDYAHLSAHALREKSPTPLAQPTQVEWASALDPGDFRSPPGKLSNLGPRALDVEFQDRLVQSYGVVSSGDTASCQASLVITERKIKTPVIIQSHLDNLEATWQRPDGEELVDALTKARVARELSCGFYYRWRWPRMEPIPVIEKWLETRKAWHKELREKLKNSKVHLDSPLLVTKAAIRWTDGYTHVERNADGEEVNRKVIPPKTKDGPLPTWDSQYWLEWKAVRDTAHPETEPVWLSDFAVEDTLSWLDAGPGLAWVDFSAFSERVKTLGTAQRLTFAGPGDEGNRVLLALGGTEAVVASIKAHGTGKNLQQFSRNLVTTPPSDGATWEQLLGRTHRQGQEADTVTFEVYRHTATFRDAIDKARNLSSYISNTFGATQRLASVATYDF